MTVLLMLSLLFFAAYGQVEYKKRLFRQSSISDSSKKLQLPPISNAELMVAAAAYDATHPGPSRFAEAIEMQATLQDGEWTEDTESGVREWSLQISSPGAITLSLLFDDFFIPENGEFYVIGLNVPRDSVIPKICRKREEHSHPRTTMKMANLQWLLSKVTFLSFSTLNHCPTVKVKFESEYSK
jgi:hypothetical protein